MIRSTAASARNLFLLHTECEIGSGILLIVKPQRVAAISRLQHGLLVRPGSRHAFDNKNDEHAAASAWFCTCISLTVQRATHLTCMTSLSHKRSQGPLKVTSASLSVDYRTPVRAIPPVLTCENTADHYSPVDEIGVQQGQKLCCCPICRPP